jgi:hypothetical protein
MSNVAANLAQFPTRVNSPRQGFDPRAILEAAGYRVRGRRADCPRCEGHSRLTVSLTKRLFYCHRCGVGGRISDLVRSQGISIPPRRYGRAHLWKTLFHARFNDRYVELANEERVLHKRARLAHVCLSYYPDHETAWQVLADLYHRERKIQNFFDLAHDKLGIRHLYRVWRLRTRSKAKGKVA